jgi:hypothetical protein
MEWQPIETAPRDGRLVELTWMENDKPQEIYPMCWNLFAENKIVQDGKGLWAMHNQNTGQIMATWTEADPEGGPTHWRPIAPTSAETPQR